MNMDKMNKFFGWSLAIFAGVALMMIAPDVAAGNPGNSGAAAASGAPAGTLGAVATKVKGSVSAFKALAVNFAFLGGAVLFVSGLFLVYKDTKQPGQNHMKNGVIAIIVGVCLLSMPTLVDVVVNTGLDSAEGKASLGTY